MNSYAFNKSQIKHTGKQIFHNNDVAHQKWVPAAQIPSMVNQFTQQVGMAPANPQDIYFLLHQVDDNGRVTEKEWLLLLKLMAKINSTDQVKAKKMKWGRHH